MLIPGIILIAAGVIFVVCSRMAQKYAKNNEEKWIETTGKIVGYNVSDNTSWSMPIIEFLDGGKQARATGPSMRDKSRPPAGTEVEIQYLKHEHTDKKPTYQVVLRRPGQAEKGYLPKVLIGIGAALCVLGVLLILLL